MAKLLISPNINLPFVHFIGCWVFRTIAHGQKQAASKAAARSRTALGWTRGMRSQREGICWAKLYASNVNRKIDRQWKAYPMCVGGWSWRLCALPILLVDVLTFLRHARPWAVPLFFQAIVIITTQRTKNLLTFFRNLCRVLSRKRACLLSSAQM